MKVTYFNERSLITSELINKKALVQLNSFFFSCKRTFDIITRVAVAKTARNTVDF